jgi:hypothetical protein
MLRTLIVAGLLGTLLLLVGLRLQQPPSASLQGLPVATIGDIFARP